MKTPCHLCKYRVEKVRDTHIACCHPKIPAGFVPLLETPPSGVPHILPFKIELIHEDKGRSWFNWPVSFAALWIKSCAGFRKRPIV